MTTEDKENKSEMYDILISRFSAKEIEEYAQEDGDTHFMFCQMKKRSNKTKIHQHKLDVNTISVNSENFDSGKYN